MSIEDIDSHKLMYHPEEIVMFKRGKLNYPIEVEIGLTNRCSHRCIWCTLDWITHGTDTLDTVTLLEVIKDFKEIGVKSVYLAGEGEPTLHKDLDKIVKAFCKSGVKVAMATNGSLYTPSLVDKTLEYFSWIRFSLDAATSKTHAKMHGVSEKEFPKIIKNIGYAARTKLVHNYPVEIGIQVIFTPETAHEIEDACVMARDLCVDNFQVKPAHNHPNSSYSPEIYDYAYDSLKERLKKYKTDTFKVLVRTKSMERLREPRCYDRCWGFEVYGLIQANGDVSPCNVFYKNRELQFGNIYESRFKDIWFGKHKQEIAEKIKCTNFKHCGVYRCRFDVLNRYLHRLVCPEPNDVFI